MVTTLEMLIDRIQQLSQEEQEALLNQLSNSKLMPQPPQKIRLVRQMAMMSYGERELAIAESFARAAANGYKLVDPFSPEYADED